MNGLFLIIRQLVATPKLVSNTYFVMSVHSDSHLDWVELADDKGRPFYVNKDGVTSWTMPKSILAHKKAHNPHWPWVEMLSDEGAPYYWNQETDETLWDRPQGWDNGAPSLGKKWGKWTECVGPDGAYFWNEEYALLAYLFRCRVFFTFLRGLLTTRIF